VALILNEGYMSLSLIGLLNLEKIDLKSGKIGSVMSSVLAIIFIAGLVLYLPIYLFYYTFTVWPLPDSVEAPSKYAAKTRKRKKVDTTVKSLFKRRRFEGGDEEEQQPESDLERTKVVEKPAEEVEVESESESEPEPEPDQEETDRLEAI